MSPNVPARTKSVVPMKVNKYFVPEPPKLRNKIVFSPYAWAKLKFIRDLGDTEVGFFGVGAADNPLFIEDVMMVKQVCSGVTVEFDEDAVNAYVEDMAELGYTMDQCFRVWIHTHPGSSPTPSGVDETTFAKCFGAPAWSVMFIIAKGGDTYCRIKYTAGPGYAMTLPVEVTTDCAFPGVNYDEWIAEYEDCCSREIWTSVESKGVSIPHISRSSVRHGRSFGDDGEELDTYNMPGHRLPSAYQTRGLPPITTYRDQVSAEDAEEARRLRKDEEDAAANSDYIAKSKPDGLNLDGWKAILRRVAKEDSSAWIARGDRIAELNAKDSHTLTQEEWEEGELLHWEELAEDVITTLFTQGDLDDPTEPEEEDEEDEEDEERAISLNERASKFFGDKPLEEITDADWERFEEAEQKRNADIELDALIEPDEAQDEAELEREIAEWQAQGTEIPAQEIAEHNKQADEAEEAEEAVASAQMLGGHDERFID